MIVQMLIYYQYTSFNLVFRNACISVIWFYQEALILSSNSIYPSIIVIIISNFEKIIQHFQKNNARGNVISMLHLRQTKQWVSGQQVNKYQIKSLLLEDVNKYTQDISKILVWYSTYRILIAFMVIVDFLPINMFSNE